MPTVELWIIEYRLDGSDKKPLVAIYETKPQVDLAALKLLHARHKVLAVWPLISENEVAPHE